VITLSLLHPIQSTPVQSWTFDHDDVIRIGRSTDNHVVLYSAVVSRHHVEVRYEADHWEVVSLGANGTYIDGRRVVRVPVGEAGLVFRLARSGPNIQVIVGAIPVAAPAVNPAAANAQAAAKSALQRLVSALPDQPTELGGSTDVPAQPVAQPAVQAVAQAVAQAAAQPVLENLAPPDSATQFVSPSSALGQNSQLMFSLTTGEPLNVLQTLGSYQVLRVLGQGETGITCLAWRNGQTVALKTLNAQWKQDPKAAELFADLASTLQRISHPGIPKGLDQFALEGQTYLVMEMVYGQTLRDYVLQKGPVVPDRAIRWALEICDSLAYLHDRSMVHHHITPAHVILKSAPGANPSLALVDFGAVRVHSWQAVTGFDIASYAAPEQLNGPALPQSDLYALGTTLAFLLTAQEPAAFYRQSSRGDYRFDPTAVAGLSEDLTAIIFQLTNADPAQRYQSAADVAAILKQVGE
jgi:Protein kinase domain/FHA domain